MREYLREYGVGRRTLNKLAKDNKLDYKNPSQILRIIKRNKWEYKINTEFYEARDLALASLLYLSSGRINEVLRIKASQIIPDDEDSDFMIIQGFYVSKRKAGKQNPIIDIPLPLVGKLKPFTQLVLDYVKLLGPDENLFTFGRARAWAIIRCMTAGPDTKGKGWFNHWFRAQSLSYHVNLIRSTVAVASQRGVENPATLMKYYRGDWKQYRAELKQ